MQFDWSAVNWPQVGTLSAMVFLAALIGQFLSLGHRFFGATLISLLFAALYIFWTQYPHGIVLPGSGK